MALRMSNVLEKFAFAVEKDLQNVIFKRFYCSNKTVKVRFAPSPTGLLHLGGLRTALYNYLFAKSKNGVSILRIEDTDQARKIDSVTDSLIKDLAWCGIKFDEGPYFQSERNEIYKKYIDQLLEEGKAYYCFCSRVRLELLRREAIKGGEIPRYDNCCRNLMKDEIDAKLKNGEVPCIRFKLLDVIGPIKDLIQDPIIYEPMQHEGDPIILKADGFPTYHFANVVDDHLMEISHVLRGVEWQMSTAKHLLLYKAFNWKPPLYAHIPLLLNSDGLKLSKRHGDLHIQGLRNDGYFPNAVLNFVVRYGGGFRIEQKEKDVQIFTIEQLLERFDLDRVKPSSSKITSSTLNEYNTLEIKRLLTMENGMNDLVKQTQQIISKHVEERKISIKPNVEPEYIKLILRRMSDRITKLDDLKNEFFYLWFWDSRFTITQIENINLLENLSLQLNEVEWNLENLKIFLKEFLEKNKIHPSKLKLIRVVLIGKEIGPSVLELLTILGKETVRYRLEKIIENSKKNISAPSQEISN